MPKVDYRRSAEQGVVGRLEALGHAGLCVSFCFGPCGDGGPMWTVNVLSPSRDEFERPYSAESFEQAVGIAEMESERRGWYVPKK